MPPPLTTTSTDPRAASTLTLDLWTDLGCPWCYIGERRLHQAIEESGHLSDIDLRLHSYEIDPGASTEVVTIPEVFIRKHGGTFAQARSAEHRIQQLASEEGLPFTTDRPHANSFDVHRVLQLAGRHAVGPIFLNALRRDYFAGAVNPYDHDVLTAYATAAGVPTASVTQVLSSDLLTDEVREDEAQAARLGITGVPFLVLDGRLAMAGAQTVTAYHAAVEQALAPAGAE